MSEELKIVVSLRESRAVVGVQVPDCDPVFCNLEGNLLDVLNVVPQFVEEARTRWETSKLYPKCESPLPSQQQSAATLSQTSTRSMQRTPAQQTQQMF